MSHVLRQSFLGSKNPALFTISHKLTSFIPTSSNLFTHNKPPFWNSTAECVTWQQRRGLEIIIDPKAISRQDYKNKQEKNRKKTRSARPSYRFTDRTRLRVAGGRGGKGSLSMEQLRRKYRLRPDGGNGGNGGSVLIVADPNEHTLQYRQPHVQAGKGTNGTSNDCHGRNGKNLILRVPCGVVVHRVLDFDEEWDENRQTIVKIEESKDGDEENVALDEAVLLNPEDVAAELEQQKDKVGACEASQDDESYEEDPDIFGEFDAADLDLDNPTVSQRKKVVVADLDSPGSYCMVARGGKGGFGSGVYASDHGGLPPATELIENARPDAGEVMFLELELKMIADIGLVGFPNAGKSSLLRAMSRASPEVAPYPFTTLHPIIGCVDYQDGFRLRMADIPGLIEGASVGRGMGFDFLRHVERTRALLYIVDAACVDYRDPIKDFRVLVNEIGSYGNGNMLERDALIVANKIDLLDEQQVREVTLSLSEVAEELGVHTSHEVLGVSAGGNGNGLGSLSRTLRKIVEQARKNILHESAV